MRRDLGPWPVERDPYAEKKGLLLWTRWMLFTYDYAFFFHLLKGVLRARMIIQ